jgi:DNA-directed RNA polymerase subunit RPC12/RpoP
MYSIHMNSRTIPYRCRQCGASNYRRLVQRGANGVMGYVDRYGCSGCSLTFGSPSEWRSVDQASGVRMAPAIVPDVAS